MTDKKAKPFKTTTPKGVFKFPKLIEPDYGSKDYPDPDGSYKVTLVLSQEDAQALIKKLQPEFDKAIEAGREAFAKLPVANRKKLGDLKVADFYTEVYDKETEEPTGEIEFKFKAKASGTTKEGKAWKRDLAIFDAKGVPVTKLKSIWGGTIGKVSFSATPYFVAGQGTAGLSLRLEAVQIIKLSQGGNRSASDYGFGAEEDGFDSTEDSYGFTDESSEAETSATPDDEDF